MASLGVSAFAGLVGGKVVVAKCLLPVLRSVAQVHERQRSGAGSKEGQVVANDSNNIRAANTLQSVSRYCLLSYRTVA
jgi:hypothetical protein